MYAEMDPVDKLIFTVHISFKLGKKIIHFSKLQINGMRSAENCIVYLSLTKKRKKMKFK